MSTTHQIPPALIVATKLVEADCGLVGHDDYGLFRTVVHPNGKIESVSYKTLATHPKPIDITDRVQASQP